MRCCAEFPVSDTTAQTISEPEVALEGCDVPSLNRSLTKSGIMNEGIFEESIEGTPRGGNLTPLFS